jgi:hypothetical protein
MFFVNVRTRQDLRFETDNYTYTTLISKKNIFMVQICTFLKRTSRKMAHISAILHALLAANSATSVYPDMLC